LLNYIACIRNSIIKCEFNISDLDYIIFKEKQKMLFFFKVILMIIEQISINTKKNNLNKSLLGKIR